MKKITILMLSLITFWACEKEEINLNENVEENYVESANPLDYVVVSNDRLVFEDSVHFNNCLNAIAEMNDEELNAWEASLGFKSYRTYSNNILKKEWEEFMAVSESGGNTDELPTTEFTDMPKMISAISNTDCEYQIGKRLLWINKEYEYIIDNLNEELLSKVKQGESNKSSCEGLYIHKITKTILGVNKETSGSNTKNWSDSRYQYQFNYSGHTYKFVFECIVWDYYNYKVEIRNKFEYLKKRTLARDYWARAGETVDRTIDVNVTVNYNSVVPFPYLNEIATHDLVHDESYMGGIYHIKVAGTMSASTNNDNDWSTTYNYSVQPPEYTFLWNQSI